MTIKNSKRLAKAISDSGYCSRRDAEKLITSGVVAVDDVIITTPAFNVTTNLITINGNKISSESDTRLWLYHKPVGLITTHKDPFNRPTVFDALPKFMPRVISIGRLDINSEGLLLLTNSGTFARKLEMPSSEYKRTYLVRVFGKFELPQIEDIVNGITIDGIRYKPLAVQLIKNGKSNSWFKITIAEGKNREVRKIFGHFNLNVSRLIRSSYGPWSLGSIKVGEVLEVTPYLDKEL